MESSSVSAENDMYGVKSSTQEDEHEDEYDDEKEDSDSDGSFPEQNAGDVTPSVHRGIWTLNVNDECSAGVLEGDKFWVIKVDRPDGSDGGGMLIWFSDDSVIEAKEDQSERYFASFFTFNPEKNIGGCVKSHGDRLGYLESRRLYSDAWFLDTEDEFKEVLLPDEQEFDGVSGRGLPGEAEAIYIPYTTCVVRFRSPGNTGSRFTIHACYCSESPLMMEDSLLYRKFKWTSTALLFMMTLLVCFSSTSGESSSTSGQSRSAFGIWLLFAIIDSAVSAAEGVEEASDSNYSTGALFDAEGYKLLFRGLFLCQIKRTLSSVSHQHLDYIKRKLAQGRAATAIQRRFRGMLSRIKSKRRLTAAGEDNYSDDDFESYSSDDDDAKPSVKIMREGFGRPIDRAARAIQKCARGHLGRVKVAAIKQKEEVSPDVDDNASVNTDGAGTIFSLATEDTGATEAPPPLPPGWIEVHRTLDLMEGTEVASRTRHYYVHTRSGRSTKIRPVPEVPSDDHDHDVHDDPAVAKRVSSERTGRLKAWICRPRSPDDEDPTARNDDPKKGIYGGEGEALFEVEAMDASDEESGEYHIASTIDEAELQRILITGPKRARDLKQASKMFAKHVMRFTLSPLECMEVLERCAANIHEARWRIDTLRLELNKAYVSCLRRQTRARVLHCLMEGPEETNAPNASSAPATLSFGQTVLLEVCGVLHAESSSYATELAMHNMDRLSVRRQIASSGE